MSEKKPERVLCLVPERNGNYGRYGHINGYASHLSATDSVGFDGQRYGPDSEILNLRIKSQCDESGGPLYGYDLSYAAHEGLTLYEAEKAVKLLKPIERKIHGFYKVEGNPQNFAQWVNRVARAIGAKGVFLFDKERKDKTGNGWRAYTLGDAVYAINVAEEALREWAGENKRKAAETTETQ